MVNWKSCRVNVAVVGATSWTLVVTLAPMPSPRGPPVRQMVLHRGRRWHSGCRRQMSLSAARIHARLSKAVGSVSQLAHDWPFLWPRPSLRPRPPTCLPVPSLASPSPLPSPIFAPFLLQSSTEHQLNSFLLCLSFTTLPQYGLHRPSSNFHGPRESPAREVGAKIGRQQWTLPEKPALSKPRRMIVTPQGESHPALALRTLLYSMWLSALLLLSHGAL